MPASRYAAYAPLAAVLLFAAVLQGVLLLRLPTISADGIIFIGLARDLLAAPLETLRAQDQHPGFPAMLLAATKVIQTLGYRDDPGSWVSGAVTVSFVCGIAGVAVVWLMARDLFDARIATVAAIGFTVLPVPRAAAVDGQSDTPHALFYLLAAWMAVTGIPACNLRRLATAGAASGAAYWIRPEGLEVALVALPFVALSAWQTYGFGRRAWLAVGTLAASALVVAAPYMLLAGKLTSKQLQFAKVTPATTHITQLAQAEARKTPPAPPANAHVPHFAAHVAAPPSAAPQTPAPAAAAARYSPKLVLSVLGLAVAAFVNSICQGFKFVFIPLYLLGDAALYWRRPERIQVAFLAVLGATHIAILLGVYVVSGYIAHRHVIPLVGLAMPFVSLGIFQLSEWLARPLRVRQASVTIATIAVCSLVVLPYTLRRLNREFVPVIEAARWIRTHADPGAGIVCNSPYVQFYGKLPVAELGFAAPTLAEALAKAPTGVRYDYVVLHVNAHGYRAEWLDELKRDYDQVRELPDPYSARPRKVLVFQAKASLRHASRLEH